MILLLASFLIAQTEPWESLETTIDWQSKDLGWEQVAPDTKLVDFVQPENEVYLVFERSWKFPKRESFPWIAVTHQEELDLEGTELTVKNDKDIIELTTNADKVSSILEIRKSFCVIEFSDVAQIFVPPHLVTSQAISVLSVTEKKLEKEILQTEVSLKSESMLKRMICFSKDSLNLEQMVEVLPTSWQLKRRVAKKQDETPYVALPQAKDVSIESFKEPAPSFSKYWSESLYESSTLNDSLDLQKFLNEGSWETRRGFTRYGMGTYDEAVQRLGPNSSIRVRIERYPLWSPYTDPCYRRR